MTAAVTPRTASAWKRFYAAERADLGPAGLQRFFDAASKVEIPPGGALVFPHTRFALTGHLVAAVATAVLDTGADEVLALGVLHGGRERDAADVRAARAGDAAARHRLRRVHGSGAPGDPGIWQEEFSLDGFQALVEAGARKRGCRPPHVLARYPFLAGDDPESLPGLVELRAAVARGVPVVATADPIHHGAGYGTPESERRSEELPETFAWARRTIQRGLDLLCARRWTDFAADAVASRSDFRDTGPVLAALLAPHGTRPTATIHALELVDYADVLLAARPTWVAGALVSVAPTP